MIFSAAHNQPLPGSSDADSPGRGLDFEMLIRGKSDIDVADSLRAGLL